MGTGTDDTTVETEPIESPAGTLDDAFDAAVTELTESNTDEPTVEDEPEVESEPAAEGGEDAPEVEAEVFTVKVDGEEIQATLDELKGGYMRQADYTRKTQELAEARKRAEAFDRLDAMFATDPQRALQTLAESYGVNFAGTPAESEDLEDLDPVERELREVKQGVESMRAEWERQQAAAAEAARLQQISATARQLHGEYGEEGTTPEQYEQELLEFAVKNDIGDLHAAAHFLSIEKAVERQKREKAEAEEKRTQAKREAPPVEGGATRKAVVSGKSPNLSLDDALEAAWAELT